MSLVYRRCAGLDVHRDRIAACIRICVNGKNEEHHEVFRTFTADLRPLARWLKEHRVRHVAMESTGGCVLDSGLECAGRVPLPLRTAAGQPRAGSCAGDIADQNAPRAGGSFARRGVARPGNAA